MILFPGFLLISLVLQTDRVTDFHPFLASHTGFDRFNCMFDPISTSNRSHLRFTVQPVGPAGPSCKTMDLFATEQDLPVLIAEC